MFRYNIKKDMSVVSIDTRNYDISMGTGRVTFATGGGLRGNVFVNGNVGIGTPNTSSTLSVLGPAYSTVYSERSLFNVSGNDSLNGDGGATVYSAGITLNASDLVWGGGALRSYGAKIYIGGGFSVNASVNHAPITFHTGGVEKMRLHTNGCLGINTTTPTQALDVNGIAKSTYFGTKSGSLTVVASSGTATTIYTTITTINAILTIQGFGNRYYVGYIFWTPNLTSINKIDISGNGLTVAINTNGGSGLSITVKSADGTTGLVTWNLLNLSTPDYLGNGSI